MSNEICKRLNKNGKKKKKKKQLENNNKNGNENENDKQNISPRLTSANGIVVLIVLATNKTCAKYL